MSMNKDEHRYDDIIDFPHHISITHPHMSIVNRAAQFSAFAALSGFEDETNETERLTSKKIELDDNRKQELDVILQFINTHINEHPMISVTFFLPDTHKEGGEYVVECGNIKKIDIYGRCILIGQRVISIEDILAITIIDGE